VPVFVDEIVAFDVVAAVSLYPVALTLLPLVVTLTALILGVLL
jgi:hypothetical protein